MKFIINKIFYFYYVIKIIILQKKNVFKIFFNECVSFEKNNF